MWAGPGCLCKFRATAKFKCNCHNCCNCQIQLAPTPYTATHMQTAIHGGCLCPFFYALSLVLSTAAATADHFFTCLRNAASAVHAAVRCNLHCSYSCRDSRQACCRPAAREAAAAAAPSIQQSRWRGQLEHKANCGRLDTGRWGDVHPEAADESKLSRRGAVGRGRARGSTNRGLSQPAAGPHISVRAASASALSAWQAGLDEDTFVPSNGTYIASSYVKFVESGGARVVPILADTPAHVVSALSCHAKKWLVGVCSSCHLACLPTCAQACVVAGGFFSDGRQLLSIRLLLQLHGLLKNLNGFLIPGGAANLRPGEQRGASGVTEGSRAEAHIQCCTELGKAAMPGVRAAADCGPAAKCCATQCVAFRKQGPSLLRPHRALLCCTALCRAHVFRHCTACAGLCPGRE